MPERVRIEKLEVAPDALYKTADKKQWVYGAENDGLSPPIGYWIEGELTNPIKVGYPVIAARDTRNGVKVDGYFQSSPVKMIIGDLFTTMNSVYRVTKLNKVEN